MEQRSYITVFITTGSLEEAEKITRALLERRQAACVNIVPGVKSHYWWQDRLDSAEENLLIIKTRENRLPDIVKLVKELHSYAVPEIIALPITGGSPEYLDWIDHEVR